MLANHVIYKICPRAEWDAAEATGSYRGSADDLRDGFIHFSRAHQLATTAEKYFAGRDDLCLIAVDGGALGAALRDEPSRGGDLFPHLYAALPTRAALWCKPLGWDGQAHVWPAELQAHSIA